MSTYEQDRAALTAAVIKQQQEATDARALFEFYARNHQVVPCDANKNILKSYFNGSPMDLSSLEEAVQNPALRKQLVFRDEGVQRAEATAVIQQSGQTVSKYQSTDELIRKSEELRQRKILGQKSPAELRAIIAAARPAPVEDDAVIPPEITRKVLLEMNAENFRRCIRKYGNVLVAKRLTER